jgi:hypothetical protein
MLSGNCGWLVALLFLLLIHSTLLGFLASGRRSLPWKVLANGAPQRLALFHGAVKIARRMDFGWWRKTAGEVTSEQYFQRWLGCVSGKEVVLSSR